jgi:hypothetical protein
MINSLFTPSRRPVFLGRTRPLRAVDGLSIVDSHNSTMGDLLFRQTVDRTLVHPAAVSEVFVTDMRPTSATAYLAGAQLPVEHHYYGDQVTALLRPAFTNISLFDHVYDHYTAMVLVEGARQAAHLVNGGRVFGLSLRFSRFAELDTPCGWWRTPRTTTGSRWSSSRTARSSRSRIASRTGMNRTVLVTGGNRGIGSRSPGRSPERATTSLSPVDRDRRRRACSASSAMCVTRRRPARRQRGARTFRARRSLVANAGITRGGLTPLRRREDFTGVLNTNVTGVLLAAKHAITGVITARWGRLIFLPR